MHNIDLAKVTPVTDTTVSGLVSPAAYDELAERITASTPAVADVPLRPRRRRSRRLLLSGALSAAAAAALVIGVLVAGGGNGANSQQAIQAVSFVTNNGQITVIIRNPYADASWYNADFARHHLNIQIDLISASPSFVGAIEYESTDSGATSNEIKNINKPGPCMDATGCTIGFTVPAGFRGSAVIGIGRPPRPGEQYETTAGSSFDPEEALHGLSAQVLGHPITEVAPILAARHVTITQCRQASGTCDPSRMPGSWYIQAVSPWAPGQVIVWIGPHKSTSMALSPRRR